MDFSGWARSDMIASAALIISILAVAATSWQAWIAHRARKDAVAAGEPRFDPIAYEPDDPWPAWAKVRIEVRNPGPAPIVLEEISVGGAGAKLLYPSEIYERRSGIAMKVLPQPPGTATRLKKLGQIFRQGESTHLEVFLTRDLSLFERLLRRTHLTATISCRMSRTDQAKKALIKKVAIRLTARSTQATT